MQLVFFEFPKGLDEAVGGCQVLCSLHKHNDHYHLLQRPGEAEAWTSPQIRERGQDLLETPPPISKSMFSWAQAHGSFLATLEGLGVWALHLSRA